MFPLKFLLSLNSSGFTLCLINFAIISGTLNQKSAEPIESSCKILKVVYVVKFFPLIQNLPTTEIQVLKK